MKPIIDSILQTDLYKLTMQQAVFHQYPNSIAKYKFKCRNENIKLGFLKDQVREQIDLMATVLCSPDEADYLRINLSFLSGDYIEYLWKYRFNPSQVTIENVDGELVIGIEGPWVETILWEVPVLAIVNQLYFQETSVFRNREGEGIRRLRDKINIIRQYPTFTFAEFGTRRRYSVDWQKRVVEELKKNCPQMVGTSNVKLAMDLNLKPIGTVAHEWFSAHLALVDNLSTAQKRAMHVWQQEYGTDLGTMLSDTFTTRAFFKDFDIVLAREASGVRQDSGDPIVFGNNVLGHYNGLGIDPKTKMIVFSDGLDIPKAVSIYKEFVGKVGVSFGIGTNLSNDLGVTPLNIVIKLIELNGIPVVKLSDNPSKAIGDPEMVEKVKEAYGVELTGEATK